MNRIVRSVGCSGVGVLFLTLASGAGGGFGPAAVDRQVVRLVELVNDYREDAGCPRLTWNDDIAAVALVHSRDMVERGFFDHVNPDGESPFDRLHNAGIFYVRAAENIAAGYATAEDALRGWLDSPEHRTNIEMCSMTEHGVGLYRSTWTHLFVRP